MTNDLRRALDDAIQAHKGGDDSASALPNLKAVLRFAAKLHQKVWWATMQARNLSEYSIRNRIMDRAMNLREGLHAAIAASPEWRAAWLAETGIDYKEIEHD